MEVTEDELEAAKAKKALGIGTTLEERIAKLKGNDYQYASAGDTKAIISRLEFLELENQMLYRGLMSK